MCVHTYTFSHVQFFETPWTLARSASLSLEFSTHEYWSSLPYLTPGNLPNPVIEPTSLASPVLIVRLLTTASCREPIELYLKVPMSAGRDWGQEEKGTTEDEMAGWHHQLDGHEFE